MWRRASVCACACVFNSLRESIWVFLCCQIWWFGGNFSSLGFKAFLLGAPGPRRQGMKHSAFIFNDINLSTGTISGCWLRFDSMFPCFHLRDTCTRFFFFFLIASAITIPLSFLSHLHADNNQQLPDGAVQAMLRFLTYLQRSEAAMPRRETVEFSQAASKPCENKTNDGGLRQGVEK